MSTKQSHSEKANDLQPKRVFATKNRRDNAILQLDEASSKVDTFDISQAASPNPKTK